MFLIAASALSRCKDSILDEHIGLNYVLHAHLSISADSHTENFVAATHSLSTRRQGGDEESQRAPNKTYCPLLCVLILKICLWLQLRLV